MRASPQVTCFSDGERFPYLEDESGEMSMWPTLFTIANSRQQRKQYSTIRNELAAIRHLQVWERLEDRDLLAEFAEQRFLTPGDIESLRDHCYRDAIDLKRYLGRVPNLSAIELAAPINAVSLQSVRKSHAYNRLTVCAKYLYFCAVTLLRTRPNAGVLASRAKEMREQLLASRPKGKKTRSGLAVHPAPQHFDEFMALVAEDSPDNPFRSPQVRKRNWVMFQILFETGMRSGELLGLYVGDVLYDSNGEPTVRIKDRRDDRNDPRPFAPQVKTLERELPISQMLYEKIQEYISKVRYHTPSALKHPFLFVNHRRDSFQGAPLGDRNFQSELKRVVSVRPDRLADIRRHGFRHNFNVRLTYQMDIYSAGGNPLTEQQRLDIRKRLNGWDGDKTGEIYERGAVQRKAMKAGRALQDKQSSVLKRALNQARKVDVGD